MNMSEANTKSLEQIF